MEPSQILKCNLYMEQWNLNKCFYVKSVSSTTQSVFPKWSSSVCHFSTYQGVNQRYLSFIDVGPFSCEVSEWGPWRRLKIIWRNKMNLGSSYLAHKVKQSKTRYLLTSSQLIPISFTSLCCNFTISFMIASQITKATQFTKLKHTLY